MNKGDEISIVVGLIGSITSASIDSSRDDTYDHTLRVTSASNGNNGGANNINSATGGAGGSGGVASGGNMENINGNTGTRGSAWYVTDGSGNYKGDSAVMIRGAAGGTAVYSGGNTGGTGGWWSSNPNAGKSGFVKIYRGNTNIIA